MATFVNSVMLIGIVSNIDIDQEEGIGFFTITTNECPKQKDGSFANVSNVIECIALEPLATKMKKQDLAGHKIACVGRLISSRDSARQKTLRKWIFVQIEDYFKVER